MSSTPSNLCKQLVSRFFEPGYVMSHIGESYDGDTISLQGFNAINGSELAGAKESGLTYYQVWNSSQWTLNDGPQGLQRLDNVIETAGKYGIKVILAFTNNW